MTHVQSQDVAPESWCWSWVCVFLPWFKWRHHNSRMTSFNNG